MFDVDGVIRSWRRELAAKRSFSRDQLDELEDHVRSTYRSLVEAGARPAEAWASARRDPGTAAELSEEFRKVEGAAWRRVMKLGWALFAVSFFLPVHRFGLPFSGLEWSTLAFDLPRGALPGIEAFLVAITGEGGAVGVASALTNALMLATLWRIGERGRTTIIALAIMMSLSVFLNVWWMQVVDAISDLRVGYYAWLGSFGLVSAGLLMRARSLEPAPKMKPVTSA